MSCGGGGGGGGGGGEAETGEDKFARDFFLLAVVFSTIPHFNDSSSEDDVVVEFLLLNCRAVVTPASTFRIDCLLARILSSSMTIADSESCTPSSSTSPNKHSDIRCQKDRSLGILSFASCAIFLCGTRIRSL